MQRAKFQVESRVRRTAFVIEVNHIRECQQASVVHLRRGAGDFTQRRRFERAAVLDASRHRRSSLILQPALAPCHPDKIPTAWFIPAIPFYGPWSSPPPLLRRRCRGRACDCSASSATSINSGRSSNWVRLRKRWPPRYAASSAARPIAVREVSSLCQTTRQPTGAAAGAARCRRRALR